MHEISLHDNAHMFKALGDETRIRMLGLLTHGELCVCDIMEVLGLPQSTASRHLAYLRNSDWVCGTRRGKWMYYKLDSTIAKHSLYNTLVQYLADLNEVQGDHDKLVQYLKRKNSRSCD
ncbi:MAG: ArsR/SmtB family transcription factor [Desulforhopalus sp.]